MTPDDIRSTIRAFLALIQSGTSSAAESELLLVILLDHVAIAMHHVEFDFDEADYPDPPRPDQDDLRAVVSERFPRLGYYNTPEHVTEQIAESGCAVADAIDDVLDIANDLFDVEWRWTNTSEDDALWHLRQSFDSHWHEHLRGLQMYLQRIRV